MLELESSFQFYLLCMDKYLFNIENKLLFNLRLLKIVIYSCIVLIYTELENTRNFTCVLNFIKL